MIKNLIFLALVVSITVVAQEDKKRSVGFAKNTDNQVVEDFSRERYNEYDFIDHAQAIDEQNPHKYFEVTDRHRNKRHVQKIRGPSPGRTIIRHKSNHHSKKYPGQKSEDHGRQIFKRKPGHHSGKINGRKHGVHGKINVGHKAGHHSKHNDDHKPCKHHQGIGGNKQNHHNKGIGGHKPSHHHKKPGGHKVPHHNNGIGQGKPDELNQGGSGHTSDLPHVSNQENHNGTNVGVQGELTGEKKPDSHVEESGGFKQNGHDGINSSANQGTHGGINVNENQGSHGGINVNGNQVSHGGINNGGFQEHPSGVAGMEPHDNQDLIEIIFNPNHKEDPNEFGLDVRSLKV